MDGAALSGDPARRLRLLHVIASVDPNDGGPIEGLKRQEAATRDRVAREVASLDAPDAPYIQAFPVKVHALGARSTAGRPGGLGRFGYSPRLTPWLKAHAADYDAVVVNGLWNYAAVGASRALPKGGVPYFVFSHGMLDPWFRQAKPVKHWIKQASWLAFEGRLLAGARAVLFTSEEERRLAQGQFVGWPYHGEVVAYGAADVKAEAGQLPAFRSACPALGARPYLLFLSRIHPKKGCDLLIRAFAEVADGAPDLQLVIAGPDQTGWADTLKAEAAGLGLADRIHWPGMLQGPAKWGAFRGADAFVLPSHQENFGIAVAEAMACETPVLITEKVNIWREVQADGAGFVEPDTQAGVASLLRRWLALSGVERAAMRKRARNSYAARFDVQRAADQLVARIAQAIHPRPAPAPGEAAILSATELQGRI